jgi:ankyrin repeat protein
MVMEFLQIGWTALHFACHEGHAEVVSLLLKAGAVIDTPAEVSADRSIN